MLIKGDRSLVALLLPDSCIKSGLQIIAQGHRCLLAYPENTYISEPAMTRYEFAPGLDACLEQIQQQLAILNTGRCFRRRPGNLTTVARTIYVYLIINGLTAYG